MRDQKQKLTKRIKGAAPYGAPPPKPGEQPSKSLWVGNLPQDATENDLRREFSMFGMIEHVKVHYRTILFTLYLALLQTDASPQKLLFCELQRHRILNACI